MRNRVLAAACVSGLLLTACGTPGTAEGVDGAADAADAFVSAMQNADGDAACGLLPSEARELLAEENPALVELHDPTVSDVEESCTAVFSETLPEVLSEDEQEVIMSIEVTDNVELDEDGDSADVELDYLSLSGAQENDSLGLDWDGERWLISDTSFMMDVLASTYY